MTDLAEFLLVRIAEDEEVATRATWHTWKPESWRNSNGVEFLVVADHDQGAPAFGIKSEKDAAHIARHDPARVLAECEAKRRIVEEHGEGRPWSPAQNPGRCRVCTAISADGGAARFRAPCPTLRLLALPYAEHEAYREEWRP